MENKLSPTWKSKYENQMAEAQKIISVPDYLIENFIAHRLVGASEFQDKAVLELKKLLESYEQNKHKMIRSDYEQRRSITIHCLTIVQTLTP